MTGSWLGYALANMWCYALGVMVVSVSAPDANLVNALLLAQGGLLALGLILLDEIDNAYGDVYSASVNSHSIFSGISARQWGIMIAVLCTGLAMVLPMHSLEPFLLTLSSVFLPLFGVILGRLGFSLQRHRHFESGYQSCVVMVGRDCDLPTVHAIQRPVGLCHSQLAGYFAVGLADQPHQRKGFNCITTGANPWFNGPCPLPVWTGAPWAMACRMNARAVTTADAKSWPKANCVAIADDRLQPVPWTLRLCMRADS